MNHLELWEFETYESPQLIAWIKWCDKAEKICGHSLDGDKGVDRYCMDDAYEAFLAGKSPQEYAFLAGKEPPKYLNAEGE